MNCELGESLFQFLNGQIACLSQLLRPIRLLEIRVIQPQHVLPRDAVIFTVDADVADYGFARVGIANVCKQQRNQLAILHADHCAAAATDQKPDRGISQFAAIRHIERNRVAATNFVADVFVAD